MPVPIVSCRLHEPFNLALGEVLASSILGVWQPNDAVRPSHDLPKLCE
jgi:hypothetical protein